MRSYPLLQLLALGLCLVAGWLAGEPAVAHNDTQAITMQADTAAQHEAETR